MAMRTKKELLEHYSEAEIEEFYQFDAFTGGFDSIVRPYKDGIAYFSLVSSELFAPAFSVRVFIRPGTKQRAVVKALRGIADWIEKSYNDESFGSEWIKETKRQYVSKEGRVVIRSRE